MPDFESVTVGNISGDAAPTINAALQGSAPSVRITSSLNIASPINIPAGKLLYSESPLYLTKQFNGVMIFMQSESKMYGLQLEGNGGAYDGAGVVFPANSSRQQLGRFQIMRCRGPCIDASQYAAGAYANIGGGDLCTLQRQDLALAAIVLPLDEPGTTGLRRLIGLSSGGGKLLDLAGSNVTILQNCDTFRLDMSARCRYAICAFNRFAIPAGEVLSIRGSNHRFIGNTTSQAVHFTVDAIGCSYDHTNYDAGVVLDPNTAYNLIGYMPLVPAPIDNSGNDLNQLMLTMAI